jgi:hypothetical protein
MGTNRAEFSWQLRRSEFSAVLRVEEDLSRLNV